MLQLGVASDGQRLLQAGRLAEARTCFWRVADEAEAAGDAERLTDAALGLGGIWVHEHRSTLDQARVTGMQRRALGLVDPATPMAGRLRTRLAAEHAYLSGDASDVLRELRCARERGDPLAHAEALSLVHHCLLGPRHGRLRLDLAAELVAVSQATGRRLDGLMGLMWRTVDLFLAGDRRAPRALEELREQLAVDRCDALSYVVAALDVMLAMRTGRLAEAEQMAECCCQLGVQVGDADAVAWYGAQLVAIRWLQGRAEDVLPLLGDLLRSTTVAEHSIGFLGAVAALAPMVGDHAMASSALASLRSGGLDSLPASSIWLATMLGVCESAHALGDVAAAAEVYDLLVPFADLPVMASLGVACFGSAHRPLGLAAWTQGDLELGVEHLEAAITADLAVGNLPLHAIDRATLADALDERCGPGDVERAEQLRQGAIADARRFGMHACADSWERGEVSETRERDHHASRRAGLGSQVRSPRRSRATCRGHGVSGRAPRAC